MNCCSMSSALLRVMGSKRKGMDWPTIQSLYCRPIMSFPYAAVCSLQHTLESLQQFVRAPELSKRSVRGWCLQPLSASSLQRVGALACLRQGSYDILLHQHGHPERSRGIAAQSFLTTFNGTPKSPTTLTPFQGRWGTIKVVRQIWARHPLGFRFFEECGFCSQRRLGVHHL